MRLPVSVLGGALLVVLLLATTGHAGSQPDVLLAWHASLLLVALLSWVSATRSGTGRRPSAGVSLALTAFGCVVVSGFARAAYTFAAWLTVVEVAAFFAAVLLAVRSGRWLLSWAGPVLLAGGWAQTAILLYQRFVLEDPRPAGTFLNPNHLAGWLAATLLFCAGRRLGAPDDRRARWSALAAAPLVVGIVLSGSRGAWVGLGAGAVVLTLLAWPALGPAGRRGLGVGFAVLAVLATTALALRMRQPDPFRYQRLEIWRASMTPALAQPWTGTGPGQFARESPNLQFPDGRGALRYDRGFRTTHSDWIRVAAEFGWPGVAVFLWIALAVAAHVARRRAGPEPVDPGALAGLCGLFVHAAFDNLSAAPAVVLLGAVFLGLCIALDGPARRSARPLWRLLVVVLALHLFVIGELAPWRSWTQRAPAGSAELAAAWNPADAEAAMRLAETRASAGPSGWRDYAEVRRLAERAVRLSPRDGELLRRLARLEAAALAGLFPDRVNRERVAALFRDAGELQRTNPFVPLERAAFLLDTGDPAGARRAAEQALEIEPAAATPRLLLARAFLDSGDATRAERLLDEAEGLAREHAEEARLGAYARDLLTLAPELVREVRLGISEARQLEAAEPRFEPGD